MIGFIARAIIDALDVKKIDGTIKIVMPSDTWIIDGSAAWLEDGSHKHPIDECIIDGDALIIVLSDGKPDVVLCYDMIQSIELTINGRTE